MSSHNSRNEQIFDAESALIGLDAIEDKIDHFLFMRLDLSPRLVPLPLSPMTPAQTEIVGEETHLAKHSTMAHVQAHEIARQIKHDRALPPTPDLEAFFQYLSVPLPLPVEPKRTRASMLADEAALKVATNISLPESPLGSPVTVACKSPSLASDISEMFLPPPLIPLPSSSSDASSVQDHQLPQVLRDANTVLWLMDSHGISDNVPSNRVPGYMRPTRASEARRLATLASFVHLEEDSNLLSLEFADIDTGNEM